MNCPNCGAAIKDGKFCNYCGAKLPEEAKIDIKRREHRFELESSSSVRRAEIKKEREAQRIAAEERRREEIQKQSEKDNKQMRFYILLLAGLAIFCLLMSLINK